MIWRSRCSAGRALLQLLVVHLLWLNPTAAKKDKPEISSYKLDNPPSNFFYFDDSNTILLHDREGGIVHRSEDAGKSWDKVDIDGSAWDLWRHPQDNKKAYIMGKKSTHWHTNDQGKTWEDFEIPNARPSLFRAPLAFHAEDSDRVLIHGEVCKIRGVLDCKETTFYTKDGFKKVGLLRENTRGCVFAHATPEFKTGDDDKNDNRIVCVTTGRVSFDRREHKLAVSDDFFEDEEEPALEGDRTVQGIINIAVVKGYLVAAARAPHTDELAMYVTTDAIEWHRAIFPSDSRLKEDAYTILESTSYSIQVDVMTVDPPNPVGALFTSNSNGTYFTKNILYTNRNTNGIVDFEKVQNIDGIVLVNVVENVDEVEGSFGRAEKKLKSQISFNDGRDFKDLTADKKTLHLHSVTEMNNIGRVFSSPAPGIVMGVGNTGDYLKDYEEGDLWISDDAGLTWSKALEEAHKYEFGDQGSILVAIYDEGPTDEIQYSLNHGKKWHKVDLPESKIRAKALTTTPDSTAMKFFLWGAKRGEGSETEHWVFSINFEDMHEDKCQGKDFEKWTARVDDNGEASCVMGRKEYFSRRKADADCFIREKGFQELEPDFKNCECTKEDFECDYNFKKSDDGKDCVPDGPIPDPKGECKGDTKTYKASSGFRKIPGNKCEGGKDLEKEVERSCGDTQKTPVSGEINTERTAFPAKSFRGYFYLERTESSSDSTKFSKDETVVMRTDKSEVYMSRDHGKSWDQILKGENIKEIYPHPHFNDVCYFITTSDVVHYTINRGDSFGKFQAPSGPTRDRDLQALGFHADYKDWLIWTGAVDCSKKGTCHNDAWFSTDRGGEWKYLLRFVRKCEFIKEAGRGDKEKLVYCEQFKDEKLSSPLELQSSDNWFADQKTHFHNIVDFATMSEFIIVASKSQSDTDSLKVDASVDGQTFADALFPKNFDVPVQKAYTVLDSHTHAVFMHVTVGNHKDAEYGSIIKSNSNGTSYVLSLDRVNRNTPGYVDFEKMLGLEGVALVNVVGNIEDAEKGNGKKLKTMITHNDGAEWSLVKAPQKDPEDNSYACNTNDLATCSLHLHGYTERRDPRAVFSSPSAVGLMMAVGNVGEYLTEKSEKTSDTFITQDGGVTWEAVKKGNYMWEYGDQGSVIIIVRDTVSTDEVFFSLDEGKTWTPYKFHNKKVHVAILSTLPSDTSLNFLLWGQEEDSDSEIVTFSLDFSQLKERERQCNLNENDPEAADSDYYLWSPKHPLQDSNCLFGHVAQYHRKIVDRDCFNGRSIQHLHKIAKDCECTRADFECDYNFEPAKDGSCKLVSGFEPPDHSQVCKEDAKKESYFLPTGYRRVPLSTCKGGNELEKYESKEQPCPGHEPDFEKTHRGLSGFWLFIFAVVLPIGIASAVGYWVWQNWNDKFGRIRLGEQGGAFDAGQPWIKYPVAIVSGVVAVLAAVPLLVGSVWRWVSGKFGGGRRYTTRGSFARGRGDYAVVDEDELLGEDDDEEV